MQVNRSSRKETTIERQTLVLQDMFYQFTFPVPQNITLILSTLFFMSLEFLPLSFYPVYLQIHVKHCSSLPPF